MTKELEHALYQSVLYLLQARRFSVEGEARHEALGWIETLQAAYYAPPPPDPFADEPTAAGELQRQAQFAAERQRQEDDWERDGDE